MGALKDIKLLHVAYFRETFDEEAWGKKIIQLKVEHRSWRSSEGLGHLAGEGSQTCLMRDTGSTESLGFAVPIFAQLSNWSLLKTLLLPRSFFMP